MCSYLYRRGAVYCTRMIVPPRLRPIVGKSDLGRSLRTKEQADAKRLLPAWLEEAQSILAAAEIELARRAAPATAVARHRMTLEEADWEEENARYWREFDAEQEAKEEAAEAFDARLQRPEADLSDDEAAAARLLRDARGERDRYRDRYRRRKQRDERGAAAGEPGSGAIASGLPAPLGTMLDTTIVDLWAAERKPKQKGIDTHRAVARWFYDRIGKKSVDQIARQDILAFKAKLLGEGQTAANIKQKLSRLRTLLQWAADNGHAASNVAHGITIKDTKTAKNKRRPFDLPALNAIFGSPIYAAGERPTQGRGEAALLDTPVGAILRGANGGAWPASS